MSGSGYGRRVRPAYGIVRPFRTFGLLATAVVLATAAVATGSMVPLVPAAVAVTMGTALLASSGIGLPLLAARLADELGLSGHERVVDAGCGRGRLQGAVARHLSTGTSVGVDRWRGQDLSGNSGESAHRNVTAEGVAERCELVAGDVRALPLPDASADVVVSMMVTGFLDRDGVAKLAAEIARVLRPGGQVAAVEPRRAYARGLAAAGLAVTARRTWWVAPPAWVVTATAPELAGSAAARREVAQPENGVGTDER